LSKEPVPRPESTVEFDDADLVRQIFGEHDENLRALERLTGLEVNARGNSVILRGAEEELRFGERVLGQLHEVVRSGAPLYAPDVERAIQAMNRDPKVDMRGVLSQPLFVTRRGKRIVPRSAAQKAYVDGMRQCDVVFAVGPAGTGKTYLAMVQAISALMAKEVQRIVLCRPAVEAGEKLGYLPGDLAEKVNPYLRPLYDALHDLLDFDRARRLVETGTIEVAPLAFMRGRTLNNAFCILDEAQNATAEQMKMFLTRLGYDSKAVITGDITQIDLPETRRSGLTEVIRILQDVDGIRFSYLTEVDVVRHPLVQAIVRAYERAGSDGRE
jgi:phosphate starvation-inducible PhoH-like protein